MHRCDMIIDFQFGSTGKGALAGYLAKRETYDTVVCAFAPNAGHTYIDKSRGIHMMTQQLPTGISGPTVRNVLLGPGSLIHIPTLLAELDRYKDMMVGKKLIIHPAAAIVTDDHATQESDMGMSKIGSTTKGVGAAMMQRIARNPESQNVAGRYPFLEALYTSADVVVSTAAYNRALESSESILVEGAQGFSLSMYHGFYPYTTSRDVTPWQIAADCGLPFKWANYINICGTLRSFPIRVNNRDGSSGPSYGDQLELSWHNFPNIDPERTTVTKLTRRIFTFSDEQMLDALWHCGQYWKTRLFLNFANYLGPDQSATEQLIERIEKSKQRAWNPPHVEWIGYGPDDGDIVDRVLFNTWPESESGED